MNWLLNSFHLQCLRESEVGIERTASSLHTASAWKAKKRLIAAVEQKVTIAPELLSKAQHYYGLRNKLIHERATVGITDSDVDNYRATIEEILTVLFNLKF